MSDQIAPMPEQDPGLIHRMLQHPRELLAIGAFGLVSAIGGGVYAAENVAAGSVEAAPAATTEAPSTVPVTNDLLFFQAYCDANVPGVITGAFEFQDVPTVPPATLTVNGVQAVVVDAGESQAHRLYTYTVPYETASPELKGDASIDGETVVRTVTTPEECVVAPTETTSTLPNVTTTTSTLPKTTTTTSTLPRGTTSTSTSTSTTTSTSTSSSIPASSTSTSENRPTSTNNSSSTSEYTTSTTRGSETPTTHSGSQTEQAPAAKAVVAIPNYTG